MDPARGQAGLGQPRATIDDTTREFEIAGLQPAEYFLRVQADGGPWAIKSIQWRNRDHTTAPLDAAASDDLSGVVVTVTDVVPTLTGSVRDSRGAPVESAVVVAFPAQPALRTNTGLWSPLFASAPVQRNGTYRFNALPAGEYVVAAIEPRLAASWRDPEVLAALERQSARVTLSWGETVGRDLTSVVIR
jgi:hypothetical protein